VQDGDAIAVVGCTGNVGRLATIRLASMGKYEMRGVARSKEKAEGCFDEKLGLSFFEGDTRSPGAGLTEALAGASVVVMTTGTTAFPTKAWEGDNTPEEVDNKGVRNVVDAWIAANAGAPAAMKRFVLMSSVGVTRRKEFPFVILNLAGVLDAKAAGEDHLKAKAEEVGFDYTIVRPGQLFGGPYDNNYYLGTLFQLDKDAGVQNVAVEAGDRLLGDTLRSTTAEVIATSLGLDETKNTDFTVVNRKGPATSEADLQALFRSETFFSGELEQVADTELPPATTIGAAAGALAGAVAIAAVLGVFGS